MNHFYLTQFSLILVLLMGCTGRSPLEEAIEPDVQPMTFPELSQEPLAPAVALTADYFQKSYPHLSAEQFKQKWKHAQKSDLMFVRSFVNTWYDELARVSSAGPIGPCFGDPHPENFGYLLFAGNFEYTYNDVDDSGACPVIFDALRYFTTLKLVVKNNALEEDLRRAYVRYLNGEELTERPSQSLSPDPGIALNKILKRSTKKGKIKFDGESAALPPQQAQALFSLLQTSTPGCSDCKLLDAVKVQVTGGGSAGLDRYWLLLEKTDQAQQLIEFKMLMTPAAERGPWVQKKRLNRTAILQDIWGKNWPSFYAFVMFEGKPFLMRSRLSSELDGDKISSEEKKALLTEQVYLLAQLHKKTLNGSTLLEEWLGRQSKFQARRYTEAWLAAQGS